MRSAKARIESLFVYPVKGLSAQPLDETHLEIGRGVPLDREYAIGRPGGGYRPGMRAPISKHDFFQLARDDRLAGLQTHLGDDGRTLTVAVRGHTVLEADLGDGEGRGRAEAFFARLLGCPADEQPIIAHEPGRRYTDANVDGDTMMNAISLINLDSVEALSARIGIQLDPMRFRANVYVRGLPPFSERALIDREIRLGGIRARGLLRIPRCAATEVDPILARRDLPIPSLLMENYGHNEFGIFLTVIQRGRMRLDDTVAAEVE